MKEQQLKLVSCWYTYLIKQTFYCFYTVIALKPRFVLYGWVLVGLEERGVLSVLLEMVTVLQIGRGTKYFVMGEAVRQ